MKYELLKSFLRKQKIKIKDLASDMHLSRSNLSKKINRIDGADFKPDEIRFICTKFNLDANIFFLLTPSLIRNMGDVEKKLA